MSGKIFRYSGYRQDIPFTRGYRKGIAGLIVIL
jgi:hypothetical protein